ncbi:MAG: hypothetical protein ACLUKN_06070 [Bacilli bacterium]
MWPRAGRPRAPIQQLKPLMKGCAPPNHLCNKLMRSSSGV